MKFSFSDDNLFRIEEDELVTKVENVKACECVVLISENIAGLIDALRVELSEVVKQWNLRDSNIKVYNEETALENKLIVAYIPRAETKALRLPDGSIDDAKVQSWFRNHLCQVPVP